MKWKLLFLIILFLYSCSKENQNNTASPKSTQDSTNFWIKEARTNTSLSKIQRLSLLSKANKRINAYPENSEKASSLSKLFLAYRRLGDTISFRKVNKQLIALAKKVKDNKSHGEAHWDLATLNLDSQPDSAIYHYREAYQLFLKANLDSTSLHYPGTILYNIAKLKDNNKDHVGAEKDIVKAIRYHTDNNIKNKLFQDYNMLAIILNGMGKYDKSLEYNIIARKFIQFSKKRNRYRHITTNLNNIASTNLRKGDYLQSISFYDTLLQTDSLFQKRPALYAKAKSGLAYAKFKNGESNLHLLAQDFDSSNKILDSLGITYDKARNYQFKAEVLNKAGKINLAVENVLMAKNIAEETRNNDRLLSSLKLLTTLDTKNSAQYAGAYFNLSEELQRQERTIQDKFTRIELETDEVIQKNVSLAKQKETLIGLAIGLLLLGLGAFIIISQRANNQKLKFQQEQQESNQEIYNLMLSQQGKFQEGKQLEQKRISEEIHDGILGQMLGIRLILSGLNERNEESAVKQRAELIEKLRELEEEIRTISHELNSAAYLKINNFIIAIQDLIDTACSTSKAHVLFEFTKTFDWDNLDGDIKINTYRITQECLQNCLKHAKAKNIAVHLNYHEDKIVLNVIDDGVGFNIKKGRKGIGLKNITSRIEKIKGGLEIKSLLGKGTEMIISVPLDNVYNKLNKQSTFIGKTLEA